LKARRDYEMKKMKEKGDGRESEPEEDNLDDIGIENNI
jgi:hypothetical protein